jgi:uncharacterized membrane protein
MDSAQLDGLEKKIINLETEVFRLRSEFEKARREESSPGAIVVEPAPAINAAADSRKNTPAAQPTAVTSAEVRGPKMVQPETRAVQTPATNSESNFSWEWLIGGNIIGKLGIVTLIISAALFMVYALDQGWLSEWIRLLTLQAAFGALSVLSYRLYKKEYRVLPEILAICALAANIISIYSAHFVYHFLGRSETLTMMFAIMLMALAFARKIQSAALTTILFAGFYALPVIHSRGINEPGAYFTYLLGVNALYFILQYFKESPHAVWVVLAGNAISTFAWAGAFRQYSPIALLFCGVSSALLLHTAHRTAWDARNRVFFQPAAIISVNALYAGMIATVIGLNKNFSKEVIGISILCLAAVNIVVVQALPIIRRHLSAAVLIAVLLMATGITVIMQGTEEKLTLAVLFTIAMYVSARAQDNLLYFGTTAVSMINLMTLFSQLSHTNQSIFLLNFQFGSLFLYALAAGYFRFKRLWPQRFNFGPALTAVALITSLVGILTELQRVITGKDARLLMVTLLFATYALVLLTIGFKFRKVWFRQAGLFFMGLAVAKFYFIDIWQWDKSVRIIAGVIMGGGLVLISFYYEKFRNKFKELGVILLVAGIASVPTELNAVEKFRPNRFKFVKALNAPDEKAKPGSLGSILLDGDVYKSSGENDIRLAYDGKIIPYARRSKKNSQRQRLEKEIAVSDLVTSTDGDNSSILLFENPDHIRFSGLTLDFKEKDYNREALIYHRKGRFQSNVLIKSVTLTRKAGKPATHEIDFEAISGSIQVKIRNEDDEPLNLTQLKALSDKEYLIFRIPTDYTGRGSKMELYYGGDYAQKPHYDIADAISDGDDYASFDLGSETPNPKYKLGLFDPPYSIWLFRTVFWLLLVTIAWKMYSIYRRERPLADRRA